MWGSILKNVLTLGVPLIMARRNKVKGKDVVEDFLYTIFATQTYPKSPTQFMKLASEALIRAGIPHGSKEYREGIRHARHEARREFGAIPQ